MSDERKLQKTSDQSIIRNNEKSFQQGFAFLTEVFPKYEMNASLYWMLLKDLDPQDYEAACVWIAKNVSDLYPGSNLVAMIRKRAGEEYQARMKKKQQPLQLTNQHSAPPPKEWTDLVNSLAKSKEVPDGKTVQKNDRLQR